MSKVAQISFKMEIIEIAGCRENSILFLLLMLGTLWLATTLYNFNQTPYLQVPIECFGLKGALRVSQSNTRDSRFKAGFTVLHRGFLIWDPLDALIEPSCRVGSNLEAPE